jgi:ammonia channel protein AmtB
VVVWATDVLEHVRIDDPIGAVLVHLACGIWGTLARAFTGAWVTDADRRRPDRHREGLFYGGGWCAGAQAPAAPRSSAPRWWGPSCLYAVKVTGTLRVRGRA